jgi:hypothetical protein
MTSASNSLNLGRGSTGSGRAAFEDDILILPYSPVYIGTCLINIAKLTVICDCVTSANGSLNLGRGSTGSRHAAFEDDLRIPPYSPVYIGTCLLNIEELTVIWDCVTSANSSLNLGRGSTGSPRAAFEDDI